MARRSERDSTVGRVTRERETSRAKRVVNVAFHSLCVADLSRAAEV